jgi:hypothetical protein
VQANNSSVVALDPLRSFVAGLFAGPAIKTGGMVKAAIGMLFLAGLASGCKRPSAPASNPQPVAAAPAPADAAVPVAPDYDPTVLADKGGDPLQIYLAEPRNPTWASVVEEAIGGQMRRDLKQMIPEARGLSMGCRTLSCLILVDVPAEKLAAAQGVVSLVTLGPVTADLGLSTDGRAQVLVLTERRMADPADFIAWYRRVRRTTLDGIRSGKTPNPLPVPVSEIPKD